MFIEVPAEPRATMEKTKLKYIKYTKQELDKYVKDKGSCVNLLKTDMHISFPPWGFANFQETVTNIISRSKVGKYDRKLDGIVLDVRNIKVFGTNYAVHDDDPYNHIDLIANFYVFQPRIGAVITGIVKHISHRHVSAIIYRVFNVSIRFKRQMNRSLEINSKITFKIKKFDLQDGLPYIEGELVEDAVSVPAANVKRKIIFDDDEGVENALDSGISTEESEVNRVKGSAEKHVASTSRGSGVSSSETSSSEGNSDDESDSDSDKKLVPKVSKLDAACYLANLSIETDAQIHFYHFQIKIKRERITDEEESSSSSASDESEEEDNKNVKGDSKKGLRNSLSKQPANSDDDSSSSDDSDESTQKVVIAKIKKEKNATSSSDSSSSDSESSDDVTIPTAVKKEKNVSSQELSTTSASSLGRIKIKQEPRSNESSSSSSSDEDTPPPKSKAKSKQNGSAKSVKNVSFSERLETIVEGSSSKSKKSNGKTKQSGLDSNTSATYISEFASPALSSTLKPSAKVNKKTAKNTSRLTEEPILETSTPSASSSKKSKRQATDAADESTTKKVKKSSTKKDKSLQAMEDDLFSSFLS